MQDIVKKFSEVRSYTTSLCKPLHTEDYGAQPIVDVSPPKWHLAHTTWFFETFILIPYLKDYKVFNPDFAFLFNSYYETFGERVKRAERGNLTRPTVQEIYDYRNYVDHKVQDLLSKSHDNPQISKLLEIGLQHEQQHQELLEADIKYILGHNPLFPAYSTSEKAKAVGLKSEFIKIPEGVYEIGSSGEEFCFDHERGPHKTYIHPFEVSSSLITNGEYLEFIEDGGYETFSLWHEEGWGFIKQNQIKSPLYWQKHDNDWVHFTPHGLKKIDEQAPVCHVSYYEAHAFADWCGMRLPTEFEWEVASPNFSWGERWEWTQSAFLPYPGFRREKGALGEYNGKFMINQMVLRGASEVTPQSHKRQTYRNFFHPHVRHQFSGIRLIKEGH